MYLGWTLKKVYPKFILSAKIAYSPIVSVTNKDNHHNRYFINKNTFDYTTMSELSMQLKYPIHPNISIAINYINVKYTQTRGVTTRTYYKTSSEANNGDVFIFNGAGVSNSYNSFNLEIIGKF